REAFGIDDSNADSRKRMANLSTLPTHLTETRGSEVSCIDRDRRRTFRATVGFQRPNSKLVFEGLGRAFLKFLGADQHHPQASKLFGFAAPDVALKKRRCRKKEGHGVLLDEFSDGLRIERAGMKDHAPSQSQRQGERSRETERM